MAFSIAFNEEKNQLLKVTRGISFEYAVAAIREGQVLLNIKNPSAKRSHQKMYLIKFNNYVFVVPYVVNTEKQEIFLKTIYPSRFWTKKLKKLLKGGPDEKQHSI